MTTPSWRVKRALPEPARAVIRSAPPHPPIVVLACLRCGIQRAYYEGDARPEGWVRRIKSWLCPRCARST